MMDTTRNNGTDNSSIIINILYNLITYEPFSPYLQCESKYLNSVFNEQVVVDPKYSPLVDGFITFISRNQSKAFCDSDCLNWLRDWTEKNHVIPLPYRKNTNNKTNRYPLIYKKMLFYIAVNYDISVVDLCSKVGIYSNLFRKWGLYPEYYRKKKQHKYVSLNLHRNGKKASYIINVVEDMFFNPYKSKSIFDIYEITPLSKSPSIWIKNISFCDVFSGLGTVAASIDIDSERKILNDYDSTMFSFLQCIAQRPYELINGARKLHNLLVDPTRRLEYYSVEEFIKNSAHYGFNLEEFYQKCGDTENAENSRLYYHVLTPSFIDYFKKISKDAVMKPEDCLFYYSFSSPSKGDNPSTSGITPNAYINFLEQFDDIDKRKIKKGDNIAISQLHYKEIKRVHRCKVLDFSKAISKAQITKLDYRAVLRNITDNKTIVYIDSPYWATTQYKVGFSDSDHVDMLKILRKADYWWIFSMQFKPLNYINTSFMGIRKKKQGKLIKDYYTYFTGFITDFYLADDNKYCTNYSTTKAMSWVFEQIYNGDTSAFKALKKYYNHNMSGVFVTLFDFEKIKGIQKMNKIDTGEMLVSNFSSYAFYTSEEPYVQIPIEYFLFLYQQGEDYVSIVNRAKTFRYHFMIGTLLLK